MQEKKEKVNCNNSGLGDEAKSFLRSEARSFLGCQGTRGVRLKDASIKSVDRECRSRSTGKVFK